MTQEEHIYELKQEIEELNEKIQDIKYDRDMALLDMQEKYADALIDPQNFIRCCEQRDQLLGSHDLTWSQAQKDFLQEYLQFFNN